MMKRIAMSVAVMAGVLALFAMAAAQGPGEASMYYGRPWNNSGLGQNALLPLPKAPGRAPERDLTGTWDAGRAGISEFLRPTLVRAPFTPEGEKRAALIKPGAGPRMVDVSEINDALETMGDVGGFPRNLTYELRPLQIVQTPQSVLLLHMWEKRWRAIWTDGRKLPEDPDPRWYGYSVGRWVDPTTFVVESNGTDDRTWLDHGGSPHSTALRVEERYHRVNAEVLELTVTINDPVIYTKPWLLVDRLELRRVPPGTDFMEMIPSASEAQSIHKVFQEAEKEKKGR